MSKQKTGAVALRVHRMTKLYGTGSVKAFCDVAIGDFLMKSFKIVDGKNGLFVSMPREQGRQGQWYDALIPMTKQAREQLTTVVLAAYADEAVVSEAVS